MAWPEWTSRAAGKDRRKVVQMARAEARRCGVRQDTLVALGLGLPLGMACREARRRGLLHTRKVHMTTSTARHSREAIAKTALARPAAQ